MTNGLSGWFHVKFDDNCINLHVQPLNREEWHAEILWEDIIRVCFRPMSASDEIYIFTNKRSESYLIPIEADGGSELWNELIRRKKFDAKLAVDVAAVPEGTTHCWPEENKEE